MEITPFIHREKTIPLYSQLYHWMKTEIEEGRLLPGTKVPSIRQLTHHLQISRNTVDAAYQQLQAEGYLESIPRSGIWVAEIEERLSQSSEEASPAINERKSSSKTMIDFEYGNIDVEKFPFKSWKKSLSHAIEEEGQTLSQYSDKQGEWLLRQEIATYLLQSRGVHTRPEQILITSGTQSAVEIICRLLKLQGKEVAIEEPGYSGVRTVFVDQGCEMVPVPLEKDGLSIYHLQKSKAKAVYVTPSHQFPFGMILPVGKRTQMLNWAYQSAGYIIEDDYDGEFRYQGQPIPSLKSLDEEEKVIYLGTFSKSFLPSMRMSFIVFPPSLMKQYGQMFPDYNQPVSPMIQVAMAKFMHAGDFERHIRRMRKTYQRKHQTLLNSIEQHLGNKVEIIGEKSGLHILLELQGQAAPQVIEKGLKKGVKVYAPSRFWLHPISDSQRYIMLGFGGLSIEEIEEGIALLASCI